MMQEVAALPLWLSALLLVALPTAIILCGPLVIRSLFSIDDVMANNEVAGFKFATLGVVYAVILGLAVISVWEKFAEAEASATQEAGAVASAYRLSNGFDAASRAALKKALTAYAGSVVDEDWPAMSEGGESPAALAALNNLYDVALAVPANDARTATVLDALLAQLDTITDSRRERLTLAEGVVPNVIWLVLFIGALMTLGFTFFFGLRNAVVQLLMTAMLSILIFLALLVAAVIDHPFTGTIRVLPTAMELVVRDFSDPG
jgi:hypothetical protein